MIVDRTYVEDHKSEILEAIKNGSIFIYPTDTIYGLGGNALLDKTVEKIREIKKRDKRAFSVITPSKNWIINNCVVTEGDLNKYLPGPYTLFLRKKKDCVSSEINMNDDTLGVRIPDHWFSKILEEAGVPFVTTSVNISGEKNMEKIEDLSPEILEKVDYVVYEGEIHGEPSTKVNLV